MSTRAKILVVDDETFHSDNIRAEVIRIDQNVEVVVESTKEKAMQIIDAMLSELLAVITDLNLTPNGKEGFEIAIKAKQAGIPNVVIHTSEDDTKTQMFTVKNDVELWSKGANSQNLVTLLGRNLV